MLSHSDLVGLSGLSTFLFLTKIFDEFFLDFILQPFTFEKSLDGQSILICEVLFGFDFLKDVLGCLFLRI